VNTAPVLPIPNPSLELWLKSRQKITAISTTRQAIVDISIAGVLIPAGTEVIIVPAVPHHNPHIWGPTADAFDPDRWDNLPKEALDPYAFQSLIAGPRVCIGKSFAMLEFKAILVELIRKFDFEKTLGNVKPLNGLTLRPLGGLKLRIRTTS